MKTEIAHRHQYPINVFLKSTSFLMLSMSKYMPLLLLNHN